jgi:thiol-disulfide isomerase/thioredoxin
MSTAPAAPGFWRRACRGALEGAVFALLVGLSVLLVQGPVLRDFWPVGGLYLAACVPVCALGRALANSLAGALLGGVAGLTLGWSLAPYLPAGDYTYHRPALVGHVEIAGPTLAGKEFDLRQWRGKVVLVDFWATWCPPCVKSLPALRQLYDRHHDEGFEVVGVSLDRSREQLETFVRKKDLPWPQVFFPEQDSGGKNPLASKHQVAFIPTTFLVARDGRLAAVGAEGDKLELLVADLLREKPGRSDQPPPPFIEEVRIPLLQHAAIVLAILGGGLAGAAAQRRWQGGLAP